MSLLTTKKEKLDFLEVWREQKLQDVQFALTSYMKFGNPICLEMLKWDREVLIDIDNRAKCLI